MSKVFVGRISNRVSEQDLTELFSKYGQVSHVHMKQNFAFVHMDTPGPAQEAIKELNGTQLMGDTITVELAKSEIEGGDRSGGRRSNGYRRHDMMERYGGGYPDRPPRPFKNGPYEDYGRDHVRGGYPDTRDRYDRGGRYSDVPRDRYEPRGGYHLDSREPMGIGRSRGVGSQHPPPPPPSSSSYGDSNLRMDREPRQLTPRSEDFYPPPGGRGDVYPRRDRGSGSMMRYPPDDDRYDHSKRAYPQPEYNVTRQQPSDYESGVANYNRRPMGCFECGRPDHKAASCPYSSRRGPVDDDNGSRYQESRSRSPSRFERPRSPPHPNSRFDQTSPASSSDAQRQTSSWSSGYSSPSRRQGSFNTDDVRSPSPVAQYYEDM